MYFISIIIYVHPRRECLLCQVDTVEPAQI